MMDIDSAATRHGPRKWSEEISSIAIHKHIKEGIPIPMIVMIGDIRKSTQLMNEAISFTKYAELIHNFVTSLSGAVRNEPYRGWFDKFTGDGLILYWLLAGKPLEKYVDEILKVAKTALNVFNESLLHDMRDNSRNFPSDSGLALGIDMGNGYLVEVADDLTIVGSPIVGSRRMVDAAHSGELLGNLQFALPLAALHRKNAIRHIDQMTSVRRSTKEYPNGQDAYMIQLCKE